MVASSRTDAGVHALANTFHVVLTRAAKAGQVCNTDGRRRC